MLPVVWTIQLLSDYVNEIYWRETRPTDWESQIDDSLFYREGVTPTLPSAPNGLQTNVGEIKGYDIKIKHLHLLERLVSLGHTMIIKLGIVNGRDIRLYF